MDNLIVSKQLCETASRYPMIKPTVLIGGDGEQEKKGFTLVELVIVVMILGILASITISQFRKFQLINGCEGGDQQACEKLAEWCVSHKSSAEYCTTFPEGVDVENILSPEIKEPIEKVLPRDYSGRPILDDVVSEVCIHGFVYYKYEGGALGWVAPALNEIDNNPMRCDSD